MLNFVRGMLKTEVKSEAANSSSTSNTSAPVATGAATQSAANQAVSALSLLPISGPEAAFVNEKLKELYESIHKVQEDRNSATANLTAISKIHERIQADPSKKPYVKPKL